MRPPAPPTPRFAVLRGLADRLVALRPGERVARGRGPEAFYEDSDDYDAFRRAVMEPFRHGDPVTPAVNDVEADRPDAASNRRYVEGQRLHLAAVDPRARATWVLDNTDLAAPVVHASR